MREGGERQSRLPWGVSGVCGGGRAGEPGWQQVKDRQPQREREETTTHSAGETQAAPRLLKATERRRKDVGSARAEVLAAAAWGGTNRRGQGGTRKGGLAPLAPPPPGLTDTGAPALVEARTAPQALSVLCPHHLAVHRPIDDPGGTPKVALSAPC